ncbi:APC family permease [Pigmentiphaga litoralis]|uniref:APC family permease n=1 Tax=Pigmentiphaga litoralis TaxID=516702 RepID=UPI003B427F3C
MPASGALPSGVGDTTANNQPRPQLSTLDTIALVVGLVIGAGIFSAPALVAGNAATPSHMLMAWVFGGLLSLVGAMCYAELATAHPHAGGDYHYLRLAFGDKVSFLFAWARLTIIPTGSIALLGYVFGDYASQVINIGPYSSAIYAAVMVIVLTAINIIGLKSGKWTQNLLTLLEVGGVVLIIVAGLLLSPAEAPAAAASAAPTTPAVTQWGLVLIFVMLTYGGWNEAAYVSAEVIGPRRTLPLALFWSLCIVTALYLLVNLAYLNGLGMSGMAGSSAVAADTMRALVGPQGAGWISTLIAISALTSANATILTGARTNFAFGRDTPMFRALGVWNTRKGAPVNALLAQGAIALGLVMLGAVTRSGFATMVEYTAPVFWLFFVLTGIALFVLRRRMPDLPRRFKVPLYPLTPLVFCASSGYLLYASLVHTGIGALVGLGVLASGAVLLLFRGPSSTTADANHGS